MTNSLRPKLDIIPRVGPKRLLIFTQMIHCTKARDVKYTKQHLYGTRTLTRILTFYISHHKYVISKREAKKK